MVSDAVWVIVDRLTKSAHFIPFRLGQTTETLARKYLQVCFLVFHACILLFSMPLFIVIIELRRCELVTGDREAARYSSEYCL